MSKYYSLTLMKLGFDAGFVMLFTFGYTISLFETAFSSVLSKSLQVIVTMKT